MNYTETINWLYQQLPMYQHMGNLDFKPKLFNVQFFCQQLGNPQESYPCIHVAGTNGKGSTTHILASVLQETGYKVGIFTSPHLKDFRERFKINGEICTEAYVVDFVEKNRTIFQELKLSFFEMTTVLAFDYFRQKKIDIAIIEVGLGGQLDSTNILSPLVSVITNIGLDHTAILGYNLTEIATEKAGIIKAKIPVVIGESTLETKAVFLSIAKKNKAPIYWAEDLPKETYTSDLLGKYQQKNIHLAKVVFKTIEEAYPISNTQFNQGILKVAKNTSFLGRWQQIQENPLVIVDVAHNSHAIEAISKQIKETPYQKLYLVLGFVRDKDVATIIDLLPKEAYFYFCQPKNQRKYPIEKLKKHYQNKERTFFFDSVSKAYTAAKKEANSHDFIFVGGSNFVVSEII